MIPFENRFHGHSSLAYVYKNGQTIRSHSIILRYIANPRRKQSRFAVVVSKKVLKGAVKRNRVRRRIYESIHRKMKDLNGVYDIVFVVTSGEFTTIPYVDITNQINQLLNQASLIKSRHE